MQKNRPAFWNQSHAPFPAHPQAEGGGTLPHYSSKVNDSLPALTFTHSCDTLWGAQTNWP